MKKFRKLLSLVLAMVMVLAMAAPSFAGSGTNEGSKGSIVISNAIVDHSYSIYKLFDLESYSFNDNQGTDAETGLPIETGNYAYYIVEGDTWFEFVDQDTIKDEYVTLTPAGKIGANNKYYVNWVKGASAEDFAKAALEYAKADTDASDNYVAKISPDETKRATAAQEGDTTAVVEFTDKPLGYYLVDSTVGALCSLNTTNTTAEILEKNDVPEVDKKIVDGEESTSSNSASIGDTVNFEIEIDVKSGALNYTLKDVMGEGLEYIDQVWNEDTQEYEDKGAKVYLKGENGALVEQVATNNFDIVHNDPVTGGCTLTITFQDSYIKTLAGKTLVVKYSATITEDAVIAGDGNKNTATLEYGDNKTTVNSETTTYVYKVKVYKYTMEGTDKKALKDATFTLSKKADGSEPIKVAVPVTGTTYRVDPDSTTTAITTDATGEFTIEGLAAGTYYLTETVAPNGYNKLFEAIEFTIAADAGIDDKDVSYNAGSTLMKEEVKGANDITVTVDKVEVLNVTGSLLPSTGGIGTTIFYAVGIILMAGAVFFVVRRKRA